MRNHWRLTVLLTAAILAVVGDRSNTASADVHSFIAVRQELRAELLACMSDGRLDQRERELLEAKAADKLPPGALGAFRQTLDRMSETSEPIGERRTPDQAERPDRPVQPTAHYSRIDPSVPVIWSDEAPEIPVLNGPVVSEGDPAIIDGALGDEYWEVDGKLYATTDAEGAGSPLLYASRLAEEMSGDAMFISESSAADDRSVGCSGDGCGGCGEEIYCGDVCSEEPCFESPCIPVSGPWGLDWIQVSATAESFQGPMDLDGLNGNFGVRSTLNAALPLSRALGIAVQAGTSMGVSDFYGTQFTGSRARQQNFATVGLFQRVCLGPGAVKYGFAFDWLFDDYYTDFTLSQWRVKLGWEVSSVAEIGLWAAIPNDGDNALLGAGTDYPTFDRFKPFAQGSLYWTRCWLNGTTTTAYLGIAEEPGEWVFGGDARIPMGGSLAFVGNLHYIIPSASGPIGQEEEVWNVGLGIEWTPSPCANRCRVGKFTPLFRVADNGLLAVRRY